MASKAQRSADDMRNRYVHARTLRGLMDLAGALGADPACIARDAGLDRNLLTIPDGRVPVAVFYRLQQEFLRQTGNPDFGLLSGRVAYMETAHVLVYLASASKTLRDWLNLMPSVSSLLGDVGVMKIARRGDEFALEWHPEVPPGADRCLVTDNILSTTVLQMDSYCLLPVRPGRVDLSYARPDNIEILESTFRAPLYFDQPVSALYYDRKVLDFPQLHVSTHIYDAVEEEFSLFFSGDNSVGDPFSLALHSAIRRQMPLGECSIDSIASDMNVSRRTLQRRLKERDTNFQQLLQEVKSALARRYLQENQLSVIEIAFLLGYGDPSSLSAAFKSWHGCTPTEYRHDSSQIDTRSYVRGAISTASS
ncbi:MAG: AraC family transcriptional regulator [Halioglobus sp.]